MMKRTRMLKSLLPIKTSMRLCLAGSFFFICGCGKPATSPDLEPVEVPEERSHVTSESESIIDSVPKLEVTGLPSGLEMKSRVEWNPSLFTSNTGILPPPRLRVLLTFIESAEREVVAYGNLRLSESRTSSGRLKLGHGHLAERLASGPIPLDNFLIWKNRSGNETVIPIDFLYPSSESVVITKLTGTISLTTAGTSSVETISDLQSLLGNDKPNAKLLPKGAEIYLLPPENERDSSSIVVTIDSNVIISDAHVLDEKGNRLKETYAGLSRLPDGRTCVFVVSESDPLGEKWQLQFQRHTSLVHSEVNFDFHNLQIPKLEEEFSEEQKRLVRWTPSSVKTGVPTDHRVEAKVRWGNIVWFEEGMLKASNPLEISVEITGSKSRKKVGLGHLQIDSATAVGEQLIPITEESDSFSGPRDGMFAYEPINPFPRAPVDGARAVFQFQPIGNDVQTIDEFTGRFTLLTAKSQQSFVIDDILQYLDTAIEHPLLKKHNITLIPERFGKGLDVLVKADNVLVVQEMAAIDQSGGTSRIIYCGRQQFNKRTVFSFTTQDELPEVIPVRITINEGLEEMIVPFEFKNLDIPAKQKELMGRPK